MIDNIYHDDYNTYEYEGKVYHEVDAKMLWSLTHYDGPMSGIAEHKGKPYYAKCHQCSDTWSPRYFWLYPLTDEEIAQERKLNKWFRKYIGSHCNYKDGVTRMYSPVTWQDRYWAFMRPIWGKSLRDMPNTINRDLYTKKEAIGYFSIQRTRDNVKGTDYMKKIELLYHSNYWDGPLSGVCRLQGKRRWFDCVHDYHSKTEEGKALDMRIFALYNLTEEEWKEEDYWHGLFEKWVGTHTRYEGNVRNIQGKVLPGKTHGKFYEKSKKAWKDGTRKKKELTDDKLIGYFDLYEKKFRKTKYRDYWIEGESPYSIHNADRGICTNHELIEWREDAQKWDDFDSDFDGKSSGWSLCIQPDGPDTGKPFWMIVNACPWCGETFKK